MARHFCGNRLYTILYYNWWWEKMYVNTVTYCRNCAEYALANGVEKEKRPSFHPLSVKKPF